MEYSFELLKDTKKPFLFASSQMSNMGYSPYGQLKALGELYTRILDGIIVKFWNVYGVEHDLEKSHVITDFLLKARTHNKIEMLTDGSELRQFLYADDCSECLMNLAADYKNVSRTHELHISNFEWNSVMDVANIVAQLYPGTRILPAQSKDAVQKDKRNEPDPYILNFWKPKTSLAAGIKQVDEATKGIIV
jgi:nucleoside-diphosphate-sugar epimerase